MALLGTLNVHMYTIQTSGQPPIEAKLWPQYEGGVRSMSMYLAIMDIVPEMGTTLIDRNESIQRQKERNNGGA